MTISSSRACFAINVENKVGNISDPKQPNLPPERRSGLPNIVWIRKALCSLPSAITKPGN